MMKIMVVVCLLLLLSCPLASVVWGAQPAVTGVTGTISTGQTLTITGTAMVDQSTTGWAAGFTTTNTGFEGTSASADGWEPSGSLPNGCAYTTGVKLMGSKSLDCQTQGAFTYSGGSGYGTGYVWKEISAQGGSDFCARAYTAYDTTTSGNGDWPDADLKYWWLPGTGATIFVQPDINGRTTAPDQWWAYMDPLNSRANNPAGSFEQKRWYCTEFCISSSGTVQVWVDGTRIVNSTTTTRVGSGYMSLGQVTVWNTVSGFSMHQYLDGAVWGTQRIYPLSTVEIGDSATYATATKVYQEPLVLGDTSIQVKANLTGLGAGPYYLFVTNNKQETSTAYNLSGESSVQSISGCSIVGGRIQ